ncbi:hypothetical protein M9Y10_028494 [Tritrichomonas musculus]|uniref:Uncharacterized protein n=1 Tax=Tritrichomonas musculus TaxID=1915356 RepID=A0ABR2KKC2_9EUKA
MHSSDNSTQQKKEEEEFEPEELNITQFMQGQSDPESEEEVDFLNIKYRPFKHLPAKLSYKQIQEFRKKGLKTPNEQLNWLNTNKIWNSLNQDQKYGPMSIQFLSNNLEVLGKKDLNVPKNLDKINKIIEFGPPLPDQEPETYNHVLILSKEQQDTIAELAMAYRNIYPLSPSIEAYIPARQKIVTVMRKHRELDEVPPLNELLTEEEKIR